MEPIKEQKFEVALSYKDGHLVTDVGIQANAIRQRLTSYNYPVSASNKAQAKGDAAKLRAIAKASKAERSRIKNQILEDWKEPESILMALEKDLEATAQNLADGVKAFDEIEKNQKKKRIEEMWLNISNAVYPLEVVFDTRYLNKTYKIDDIQADLQKKFERLETGWNTLSKMAGNNPQTRFLIDDFYHKSGDMAQAVSHLEELQRAEQYASGPENSVIDVQYPEEKPAEPEPVTQPESDKKEPQAKKQETVCRMFFCKGTPEQFKALSDFLKETGIETKIMVKGNQSLNRLFKYSYGEVGKGENKKENKTLLMSDNGWIRK